MPHISPKCCCLQNLPIDPCDGEGNWYLTLSDFAWPTGLGTTFTSYSRAFYNPNFAGSNFRYWYWWDSPSIHTALNTIIDLPFTIGPTDNYIGATRWNPAPIDLGISASATLYVARVISSPGTKPAEGSFTPYTVNFEDWKCQLQFYDTLDPGRALKSHFVCNATSTYSLFTELAGGFTDPFFGNWKYQTDGHLPYWFTDQTTPDCDLPLTTDNFETNDFGFPIYLRATDQTNTPQFTWPIGGNGASVSIDKSP